MDIPEPPLDPATIEGIPVAPPPAPGGATEPIIPPLSGGAAANPPFGIAAGCDAIAVFAIFAAPAGAPGRSALAEIFGKLGGPDRVIDNGWTPVTGFAAFAIFSAPAEAPGRNALGATFGKLGLPAIVFGAASVVFFDAAAFAVAGLLGFVGFAACFLTGWFCRPLLAILAFLAPRKPSTCAINLSSCCCLTGLDRLALVVALPPSPAFAIPRTARVPAAVGFVRPTARGPL